MKKFCLDLLVAYYDRRVFEVGKRLELGVGSIRGEGWTVLIDDDAIKYPILREQL